MLRYWQKCSIDQVMFHLGQSSRLQFAYMRLSSKLEDRKRKRILVQLPYLGNVFVKQGKLQIQLPRNQLFLKKYGYSERLFQGTTEKLGSDFAVIVREVAYIHHFFFQVKKMTNSQKFTQHKEAQIFSHLFLYTSQRMKKLFRRILFGVYMTANTVTFTLWLSDLTEMTDTVNVCYG